MADFSWDEFAGGMAEGLTGGMNLVSTLKDIKSQAKRDKLYENSLMFKQKQDEDKQKSLLTKAEQSLAHVKRLVSRLPLEEQEIYQNLTVDDVVDPINYQNIVRDIDGKNKTLYKEGLATKKEEQTKAMKRSEVAVYLKTPDLPEYIKSGAQEMLDAGNDEGAAKYLAGWKAEKPEKSDKPFLNRRELVEKANDAYEKALASDNIDSDTSFEEYVYKGYEKNGMVKPSWMSTVGMEYSPEVADSASQVHKKRHFEINGEPPSSPPAPNSLLDMMNQKSQPAPADGGLGTIPMQSGGLTPEEQEPSYGSADQTNAKAIGWLQKVVSSGKTIDEVIADYKINKALYDAKGITEQMIYEVMGKAQ